ncbi:hypothetical protein BVG80_11240 [Sphingobacteriales bacterium TSM_CSM]|nr:hypothetical protein BVG80_11240 [Sphingobacteriales bacterium TSM_CSM]
MINIFFCTRETGFSEHLNKIICNLNFGLIGKAVGFKVFNHLVQKSAPKNLNSLFKFSKK